MCTKEPSTLSSKNITKVVKVTPEILCRLVSQRRVGSLIPAVLFQNDMGEKIIRPVFSQTTY